MERVARPKPKTLDPIMIVAVMIVTVTTQGLGIVAVCKLLASVY